VNGITCITTKQKTVQETSVVSSDVHGARNNSVITNLKESIKVHQNKEHSFKKHQIILIGDSNIKGYASSLEPLLDSNYNLYSVVKPGSTTNELEKTENEVISHLTHDDMIILCYGTNDFD
jgi:lysophospholipase L1-like esterase